MSFRELSMVQIKEVLRRWQAGQSARQVARDGVVDRKTALRYIAAATELGLATTSALDDEAIASVAARVQTRPTIDPSDEWNALAARRRQIEAWLRRERPLRLVRVHDLLSREGVEVSYSTLRRFAHKELEWRERPATVLVDDPPAGEEAQIDFGLMGTIRDEGGVVRKLWALIVVLSLSRYMFVWPTFVQTTEAICEGLDAAWKFFGGIVARVVPDNPSTMVLRANAKSPELNRAFLEYAQARGFFVDPARVRHPKDKARVENQVPFVRERWFDGETFLDLADARRSALHWCREVAGVRIHGTTRRVPREVFESEERALLRPPPEAPFDVPVWTTVKVHPDHHVQVARALYSVPTAYLGQSLEARLDRSTVRLYHRTDLIKAHVRVAPGKRSTDAQDYPVGKAGYAQRSVASLLSRATEQGANVGAFVARLLDGPLPWTKMRQAYGLLRLCEKYGAARVDGHCARALSFDVLDVGRIERMLKDARRVESEGESSGKVIALPLGRFARDPSVFATRTAREDGGAQ